MYLKNLTLNGFKSFAKKSALEFNIGITAIVGPNGSGKSNLSDAIRWVMGEQSIKTLRGKKSEDVIFSGSDKLSRLGLAEVSLHLNNADQKIPLDYSEIMITRRVFRDGTSDYLLNGAKSKLSDINLLLTKANFGHRTYSVIGQGMIDNFLVASPAERKEFFEEATGVRQYQIKKNIALKKLEIVWQNLTTLNIKIKEIEPSLKLLTRQVEKLNKRKKIEAELEHIQTTYYGTLWHEINSNFRSTDQNIQKLSEEKNRLFTLFKSAEDELNYLTKNNSFNTELSSLRTEEQRLIDLKLTLKEDILGLKINPPADRDVDPLSVPQSAHLSSANLLKKLEEINLLNNTLILNIKNKTISEIISVLSTLQKKLSVLISLFAPQKNQFGGKNVRPHHMTFTAEEEKFNAELNKIEVSLADIKICIKNLLEKDAAERASLWHKQKDFQDKQRTLVQINSQISEARIAMAREETRRFDLKKEIENELLSVDILNLSAPPSPLNETEKNALKNKIIHYKSQLEFIGGIDPEIETEYHSVLKRHQFLSDQSRDLEQTTTSLKTLIDELDSTIKHQMTEMFNEINEHFKRYFKTLFNGGRAELTLLKHVELLSGNADDEGDEKIGPANFFQDKNNINQFSGIEIEATPPGKKLKNITALSGGERALTSIALISAIISSNPAPFVVLDEVDAALDEANSIRFAEILKDLSRKTQVVIITHNRATMETADIIYGVTIGSDGVSKLIGMQLTEAEKYETKN